MDVLDDFQQGRHEPSKQHYPVMRTRDWLVTFLIQCIPIINIIMMFVWAFSSSENPNKSNFAKASLVLMGIAFVISFLIFILAGIAGVALFAE